MNFTLLTRVTKTCCNTIDGNVNKANFVIGQIIVTKTFNQFNLDVVQDVEVWQSETQTRFKRWALFKEVIMFFNRKNDILSQLPLIQNDVKDATNFFTLCQLCIVEGNIHI